MRIWFKIYSDARLIANETIDNFDDDTRTHKIFNSLDRACEIFDLSKPIWLDSNVKEFQKSSRTRFTKDNFIDDIEFDYMEIQVLEEDY
ncbi:MAG: hypothetical protein UH963_06050 [Agathobacter sp.]|nr:hypothetical protein [Agathobacter sp.]